MAEISTHAATSRQNSEGFTVTIMGVKRRGSSITGHGFTRDAAMIDAKRELARHLNKAPHEISLIVDGGR
jgi:hypothetical protein